MLQLPSLPAAKKKKHRLRLLRLQQHLPLHLLLLLKPLLALPLLLPAPRWMPLPLPARPLRLPPQPSVLMLPALPKMQPTLPKRPLTLPLLPLKSPERFALQRKQKPPPGGFFYTLRFLSRKCFRLALNGYPARAHIRPGNHDVIWRAIQRVAEYCLHQVGPVVLRTQMRCHHMP